MPANAGGGPNVVAVSGKEYEVIFDPIAKSAIIRSEEVLLLLDGPFRTYADAVNGAVVHLEKRVASDASSLKLRSH